MQTQSAFRPFEASLQPKRLLATAAKRKSKIPRGQERERDFYRLAALLANPDLDDLVESLSVSLPVNHADLSVSRWLESSYQEKSPIFLAQGQRFLPRTFHKHEMAELAKKWRPMGAGDLRLSNFSRDLGDPFYLFDQPQRMITKNGVTFSLDEQAVLLSMITKRAMHDAMALHKKTTSSATFDVIEFHLRISELLHKNQRHPFLILGTAKALDVKILVDRARLFWSHRMALKSRQAKGGAEPQIRYFHAELHSGERPHENKSVLYWLSFDEDNRPICGKFLEDVDNSFLPHDVLCPHLMLKKLCDLNESSGLRLGFLHQAVKMYLESVS